MYNSGRYAQVPPMQEEEEVVVTAPIGSFLDNEVVAGSGITTKTVIGFGALIAAIAFLA